MATRDLPGTTLDGVSVQLLGNIEFEEEVESLLAHGGELIFVVPSEPPSYDAHQEETFGVNHPMAPH